MRTKAKAPAESEAARRLRRFADGEIDKFEYIAGTNGYGYMTCTDPRCKKPRCVEARHEREAWGEFFGLIP